MSRFAKCSGLAILLIAVSCQRLKKPPVPEGVPAAAERDRATGLWSHKDSDNIFSKYHSNGRLARRGHETENGRDGLWQNFAMDGKTVTTSGQYRKDWRDGNWEFYDHMGRLYQTVAYALEPRRTFGFLVTTDYGNENGEYRRFFPDGSLEEKGAFHSGYFQGEVRNYHKNGKLAQTGFFKRDDKDGIWKTYFANGILYRSASYQSGKLHGEFRVNYPDGKLKYSTVYSNGQNVGPQELHAP